jgi:hypothetical protein
MAGTRPGVPGSCIKSAGNRFGAREEPLRLGGKML